MTLCDVSAIDQLIDAFGYNQKVIYNNDEYNLSGLREYLSDNNKSISLNDYSMSLSGLKNNDGELIVALVSDMSYTKDDLNL
jgi:hypothetical protein